MYCILFHTMAGERQSNITSMIDTFLILARGLEEASVMFRLEIME